MQEIPNSSDKTKEELFRNWLVELHGRHWSNPEAMPEGVHSAYQMYTHYINNGRAEDDPKVIENAEKFKELTGYEARDFKQFQDSLNKKEE